MPLSFQSSLERLDFRNPRLQIERESSGARKTLDGSGQKILKQTALL